MIKYLSELLHYKLDKVAFYNFHRVGSIICLIRVCSAKPSYRSPFYSPVSVLKNMTDGARTMETVLRFKINSLKKIQILISVKIFAVCDAANTGGPGLHVEPVSGHLPPSSQSGGTLSTSPGTEHDISGWRDDGIILTDLCRQRDELLDKRQLRKPGHIPSHPALPNSSLHSILLCLHCSSRVKGQHVKIFRIFNFNIFMIFCRELSKRSRQE